MHILIDQLEAVGEPRTGNAKRHKLGDILFIALLQKSLVLIHGTRLLSMRMLMRIFSEAS